MMFLHKDTVIEVLVCSSKFYIRDNSKQKLKQKQEKTFKMLGERKLLFK